MSQYHAQLTDKPPSSGPWRILVLTSSTGKGHDSRAYAFRDWVDEVAPDEAEVRIEHLLEDSSPLLRAGVHVYNLIHRHAPRLHNLYWLLVEGFGLVQEWTLGGGRGYFKRLLQEYRPHLILSVHDTTNRGYFSVAHQVLGRDRVRCVTYCGEWSAGFGYSRNWLTRNVDLYVSRTPEADARAAAWGLPAEKRRLFCNFVPPHVYTGQLSWKDRAAIRETEFGLDPDKFTLLLTTGGFGANHHIPFLQSIRSLGDRVQVIVVCGRNGSTYTQLLGWRAANPELELHLEGYSRQVHRLLQISDAVVTRGGANTAAEALLFQCPPIFIGLGGVMPQERLTINYFVRNQAAAFVRDACALRHQVAAWADFPTAYHEVRARLNGLRQQDRPDDFVTRLLRLAAETRSPARARAVVRQSSDATRQAEDGTAAQAGSSA